MKIRRKRSRREASDSKTSSAEAAPQPCAPSTSVSASTRSDDALASSESTKAISASEKTATPPNDRQIITSLDASTSVIGHDVEITRDDIIELFFTHRGQTLEFVLGFAKGLITALGSGLVDADERAVFFEGLAGCMAIGSLLGRANWRILEGPREMALVMREANLRSLEMLRAAEPERVALMALVNVHQVLRIHRAANDAAERERTSS